MKPEIGQIWMSKDGKTKYKVVVYFPVGSWDEKERWDFEVWQNEKWLEPDSLPEDEEYINCHYKFVE